MKYKLSATIPVVQYGNLMPEVEVEADTLEEAHHIAMGHIQKVWQAYAEPGKGLTAQVSSNRRKLTGFVGGEIYFDEEAHSYTNEAGERYISGSEYAKRFDRPFDANAIAGRMADKSGVQGNDIVQMWELRAKASRSLGTALHAALELYGRYNGLATALEKATNLHDHPVLKKAVESFYATHSADGVVFEALVIDHENKRTGFIDRLLITGDKKCRIQDYKTNVDIKKSINSYWHQLSFYAAIMQHHGWEVEGLDIFWWNGEWQDFSSEVKEIKE